jgi:4-hydroxy-2-oxoheptanedioate aldolase
MIKRALDAGAHGIMVPLLSSVEEVEEVVRQSKFPPSGKRGLGSPFSVNAFDLYNIGDYLSQANDNTAVIIQIETLAAYENVEAFAKVPGVDLLFIGPFDLSNALGHPLAHGVEHPVLTSAIQKILDVAHANGKKAGIFTTSGEDARKRVEQGFDMVHIGTDVHLLIAGMSACVKEARGESVGQMKGGY